MGQAHFEETIRSLEQYMEFRGMALGLREVRVHWKPCMTGIYLHIWWWCAHPFGFAYPPDRVLLLTTSAGETFLPSKVSNEAAVPPSGYYVSVARKSLNPIHLCCILPTLQEARILHG